MTLESTIGDFILTSSTKYAERIAFIERKKYRRIIWTYQDLLTTTHRVANLLVSKGFQKGDFLILCAPNSPLWTTIYFACAGLGIIIVPIDNNSKGSFVTKIKNSTGSKLLILGRSSPLAQEDLEVDKLLLEEIKHLARELPTHCPLWNKNILPEDILEIVYSSGSTGEPKGVILSHANVCSNLQALSMVVPLAPDKRFLSIIPLSHMFELTAGLLSPLLWGSSVCYLSSVKPNSITRALGEEEITSMVTVPAFMLLLKNSILQKLNKPELTKFNFWLIKLKTGIRLSEFYVGGAPLDTTLESFWNKAGVGVYQGYGMTEAAPLIATNSPSAKKTGTVGKILPGIKITIAEDGELMVFGPNVSRGYFKDEKQTKTSFTPEGWLHSGDIGSLDTEEFLSIRGRKKNTIITHSGMKVYPEDIEQILLSLPEIKDAVVLGVEKNQEILITAVILGTDQNIDTSSIVNKANSALASHQQIQNIIAWPDADFPRTPTRKIIRAQVLNWINEQIPGEIKNLPAKEDTLDLIKKTLINILNLSSKNLNENSLLVSDLGLDSIKRLGLASRLEEEIGIEIDESKITHRTTISDLRQLIRSTQVQQRNNNVPSWQIGMVAENIRILFQPLILGLLRIFQTLEITHRSDLKIPKPSLIIANHESHLDTFTVLASLPISLRRKVAIGAAKDYFFTNPILGFLCRLLLNMFPIDRDGNIRESLTTIGKFVDKNYSVLIFPEGTRTLTGKMKHFKNGIGVIAVEMELPVLPIKISGNFNMLSKSHFIPKRGITNVSIGNSVTASGHESYIDLTNKLEKIISEL